MSWTRQGQSAPPAREQSRERAAEKGTYCFGITRIDYSSHTFEIPNVTAEEAERIALKQTGSHEFSEKHSEYEVQAVYRKRS